jgi:ketosteroid isomerase-like protein
MKTKYLLLSLSIVTMTSCQQSKPADSPELLKEVLFEYFDGIKTKDFNKMNDVTTDDFILFEDGKVWNNDSLIAFINAMPKYSAEFAFDNFRINVDSESGSMSYINHCDLTVNDTTKTSLNWIESATFKKVDDKWKMNFLHSTVRK